MKKANGRIEHILDVLYVAYRILQGSQHEYTYVLDPVWGISFNMGLQYHSIVFDESLLLHVLESHEVTVPPVILPGTKAVVDICSESRESTTD